MFRRGGRKKALDGAEVSGYWVEVAEEVSEPEGGCDSV